MKAELQGPFQKLGLLSQNLNRILKMETNILMIYVEDFVCAVLKKFKNQYYERILWIFNIFYMPQGVGFKFNFLIQKK